MISLVNMKSIIQHQIDDVGEAVKKKKEAAVLAENLEKELQQVEESIVSLKKDLTLDELTEIEDEQKAIEENTKKNIVEKKKKKQSWISFKRKKGNKIKNGSKSASSTPQGTRKTSP